MNKQKEPKLRFPGFTGEWQEKRLGDELNNYRLGGNYANSEIITKHPLIKMGNLNRGKISLDKIQYIIDNECIDSKDLIKYGDLFFNTRNTLELVGKVAIWRDELPVAYYNSNLMFLEFNNNFFMNLVLNTRIGVKKLRSLATGTTSVAAIYTRDLVELKFNLPSLPEQKKIADFLSDIDTKIEKLTLKKELTEQYKKGTMQKIFSQKIRFKDENRKNYPDWQEKRLGEVADFIQTNSFSRECMNNKAGQVQNIHYGDIHVRYPSILNIKTALIPFINEDINIEKYNNSNFCQNGDIIFADASEDTKDIGKCIEITNMSKEKILAGLHTIHVRFKAKMAIGYNGYYLSSPYVKDQIMKLAQGISVFGISKKAISELEIMMPVFEEQKKIADFLVDLDTRIEHINNELAMLKEFKKGLLQGMFV